MPTAERPPASTRAPLRGRKIVVIGAGMGGLAAAARLAGSGADVAVFDAGSAPGGKMRAIDSPAGPVDAGPTVLTLRDVFDAAFSEAGERLEDHVSLVEETVRARHFWPDGTSLDLYGDLERSVAAVRAFAGDQDADAFRAFSDDARTLFEAFDATVLRTEEPRFLTHALQVAKDPLRLVPAIEPHLSLRGSARRRFRDPRLRQLFGRYATYVGGAPSRAPAILKLIWHVEARGVWRVVGGVARLAHALEGLARRLGARFAYNATVAEIEVDARGARGVRLADGRRFDADAVVFNGDPAALRRGLLGAGARRAAVAASAVSPRSLSAYVWSFAAEARATSPLGHHNIFFSNRPDSEFDDIAAGRAPSAPTLYVCAQDRGDGAAPGRLERFEIIMNGAPVDARISRDDSAPTDTAEEERTCRTRVFHTLASMGLTFHPEPPATALTTPRGFAEMFPGSDGSLYGRSPQGLMTTFRRPTPKTPIPGLYLAGGGVHPGPGAPMAALSGRHAAAAIATDLVSTSPSRRTATPGGMSTASRTTANAAYRSSGS